MTKYSSALIGVLISIMILFNGTLTNYLGNYLTTVIVHITGLVVLIAYVVIKRHRFKWKSDLNIFWYLAGAFGVLTVLINNLSFTKLGVSLTVALGLLGQTFASLVIDQYGLLGAPIQTFHPKKWFGLTLIIIGIIIMSI